ncbi:LLM class flavin-dependent oxidoreductase [Lentibacillus sediminis]|uniref:LLM class flavin-dependent oxidoreductase n=1 Tax=Lentibacillus sediminis TaxID=1940529 RepID=UPI00186528C3|nr:LLM class flavin-dependent oxidoreductase [Lentibacillus sediminis]
MTKTLSFSAFVMNTASHIVHGTWRQPEGEQIDFNKVDLWINLAKKLEEGGFDNIFSSKRGKEFAAKNAEAIFIQAPNPEVAKELIEEMVELLEKYGRQPEDLKFYQGLTFVIGDTEEEALEKNKKITEATDLKMMIAHLGGAMGIDFGKWDLDTPLENIETEGTRSILQWVQQGIPDRKATLADFAAHSGKKTRIVGTAEQIADKLEEWLDNGVSGINVMNSFIPGSYIEFIDKVMPILRERGLVEEHGDTPKTLRSRLFGSDKLNDRHPATNYRHQFAKKQPIR